MAKQESIERIKELTNEPLHKQVRAKLQKTILSMQVGDRLPSERQISTDLQVAAVTVRRAMCDLAKEGLLTRHPGRGTFVRKTVSADRSEKTTPTKTDTIALVMPSTDIPSHIDILETAEKAAEEHGYDFEVYDCNHSTEQEEQILRHMLKERPAGLIVNPFHENSLSDRYAELIVQIEQSGTSLVLIDQYVPAVQTRAVLSNQMLMGYISTEHLIMLGHTKICFVSTGHYDVSGQAAKNGHRRALEDYDIAYDDSLIVDLNIKACAEPTRDRIKAILGDNPRAFSAFASPQISMTYGALKAFEDLHLRIPEDMAVVGGEVYQNPQLDWVTHVRQPSRTWPRRLLRWLWALRRTACCSVICCFGPVWRFGVRVGFGLREFVFCVNRSCF